MNQTSIRITLLLVLAMFLGCTGAKPGPLTTGNSATTTDKGSAERTKLQGSGASFPGPIYARWFKDFEKKTGSLVDYQAKGSGAGIQDLTNETVDFSASDAAMSDEEIAKVARGVVMLPLTAGEIVLAYNLPDGPSELKLSREVYTKILMGEITKWNDPAIAACNSGAKLPDVAITVVVRSDSSGTTHVFSTHLSAVSEKWKSQYGINKTINWPNQSNFVKAPKNDGVTAMIKQTPGAIGYVEYGFAKQLGQAVLENKSGAYVKASAQSGQAALASVKEIPDNLVLWIADPDGHQSYPIVSYTWLLCYRKYDDSRKSQTLKDLIKYCLADGQAISDSIGYIPLPEAMVERVKVALDQIQ